MFNTYNAGDTTNNIKVNAISGTLVKNYQKSFFCKFQQDDKQAKLIFDPKKPRMVYDTKKEWRNSRGWHDEDTLKEIVVIQCMILADNNFLAEIMWKEDFEAMFKDAEPMAELGGKA